MICLCVMVGIIYMIVQCWKNSNLGEKFGLLGRRNSLSAMDLMGMFVRCCTTWIGTIRGAVNSVFCRWNTPLPHVDDEAHGEVPLALLKACFVKVYAWIQSGSCAIYSENSIEYFLWRKVNSKSCMTEPA